MQSQVLYVIPITSFLGRIPVVPVGVTGTIPYSMRKEGNAFPGLPVTQKRTVLKAVDGGTSIPGLVVHQYLGPKVGNQPVVGLK